jgi:hypothetical protein
MKKNRFAQNAINSSPEKTSRSMMQPMHRNPTPLESNVKESLIFQVRVQQIKFRRYWKNQGFCFP